MEGEYALVRQARDPEMRAGFTVGEEPERT